MSSFDLGYAETVSLTLTTGLQRHCPTLQCSRLGGYTSDICPAIEHLLYVLTPDSAKMNLDTP